MYMNTLMHTRINTHMYTYIHSQYYTYIYAHTYLTLVVRMRMRLGYSTWFLCVSVTTVTASPLS